MRKHNTRRFALAMIVLAGLLATNCQQQPKTDIETINFTFESTENPLDIRTIADTVYDPIVLETTDDCLIGEASKIAFAHDTIIIADKVTNSVFFFDGNGKYISKINRVGRGPEEYVELTDMYVCDNRVLIIDYNQWKVCCYNFAGKCLYHFDSKEGEQIACSGDRILCCTSWGGGEDWDDCLVAEFDQSGKMVRTYFKQSENDSIRHHFDDVFIKTDKGLDYNLSTKNIVYTLNGDGFEPHYKVDFGKYEMPDKITEKGDVYIVENKCHKQYTSGIEKVTEAGRYRLISASIQNVNYLLVYDKKEQRVIDIYNRNCYLDGLNFGISINTDSDCFYSYFSGNLLCAKKQYGWSEKNTIGLERKVQEAAKSITEEDNGLIIRVKMKD